MTFEKNDQKINSAEELNFEQKEVEDLIREIKEARENLNQVKQRIAKISGEANKGPDFDGKIAMKGEKNDITQTIYLPSEERQEKMQGMDAAQNDFDLYRKKVLELEDKYEKLTGKKYLEELKNK